MSQKQLRYRDDTGLLSPSVKRQLSERNTVRLSGFPELVELRVIVSVMGLGMSLQRILGSFGSRGGPGVVLPTA